MITRTLPDSMRADWARMTDGKRQKGLLNTFNDRKLGMFIHWGLYSVAAGMWKGERVPGLGEWIMWMADIPRDEYAALASRWRPDRFDTAEWVGLARRAGMKYIVITAKHHDGFALWDSKHSDFNIARMSPTSVRPLDALHAECRKQGIGFGLYYSHVIDWRDGWEGEGGTIDPNPTKTDTCKDNPMNTWDPADVSRRAYFQNKAYPQLEELLERYPDLHCIWFDYWYQGKYLNPSEAFAFYKLVYDKQPQCLVNSRIDGYEVDSATLGDYITAGDNKLLSHGQKVYWESPCTLNNTWGYTDWDLDWKSESEVLYWLVNIVSRGGNYLLNIGPKPDGSIPEGTYAGFDHIARWLRYNHEAVYGTTAWKIDRQGKPLTDEDGTAHRLAKGFHLTFSADDLWFSRRDDTVYAMALASPTDQPIRVTALAGERIRSLSLLGSDQPVRWDQSPDGPVVTLPRIDRGTIGFTLKIQLA